MQLTTKFTYNQNLIDQQKIPYMNHTIHYAIHTLLMACISIIPFIFITHNESYIITAFILLGCAFILFQIQKKRINILAQHMYKTDHDVIEEITIDDRRIQACIQTEMNILQQKTHFLTEITDMCITKHAYVLSFDEQDFMIIPKTAFENKNDELSFTKTIKETLKLAKKSPTNMLYQLFSIILICYTLLNILSLIPHIF